MSAKTATISEATVTRLSIYLRCLQALEKEGRQTVSSQELARQFHLNSAQIRKDLAYFGAFGTRGVGYCIGNLKDQIIKLLKIRSVVLLTNNPDKIEQLKNAMVNVVGRIPIVIPANRHDAGYLDVKKNKMGHLI